MKKLLVTLMCVAMILALMPAVAFAETQEPKVFDGNVTETLTLTGAFEANGSDGAIWAKNGANVTLNGEGSVHATLGPDKYSMAVWGSGAGTKVLINGGSYTNETDGSERGTDLIYASGDATIEINGGTFKAAKVEWTLNCKDGSKSQITVKGGSFYKFDPSNPGKIGPEGNTEVVVPDTHKVVQAGDWYYVVEKGTDPVVVDGETKTVTLTGSLIADGCDGAIWAKNGANVTLNGEGSVHATLGDGGYSMAVWALGAGTKVLINGGSYTNETDGSERGTDLIYASGDATIEINGGTFKAAKVEWTLNCKDGSKSQITVKGGSFYKFDPSNPGKIGPEGNTEVVVPDTHKVVKAGDWYTVVPKATGIALDKTAASVEVGKTVELKATVAPEGTLDTVAWTTDKAAVATVKDGVVTAVAPGTATITATVNGKSATCKVSVYKVAEPPKVDNVDTTKPVEEVKPVVKQETVAKATEEAKAVISDIAEGKATTAVSAETKAKVEAALDAGKIITTEVVVETVKEETVKDDAKKADPLLADSNVKKEIGEAKIAQYLNLEIVLKADGQELGTINELSEKMTFTIAVPEELKGKDRVFYVVRVHNGQAEVLPTTMNADGTISFTTDKFSTYALAYADPATTGTATNTKDTPKTGDATNMLPWLALMAVAGAGAVVFKRKED